MQNKPKISIITIVFNDSKGLEETIKSVINQTYVNIEYIIIDGGSTDGTVGIIKKYEDKITHWVSESDMGIYDGMNKGIDLASGDWINFMNAGDKFYSDDILRQIFYKQTYSDEIIYGDMEFDDGNSLNVRKANSFKCFWKSTPFCHQSSFINAQYHKKYKYSLLYSISGDFDFFYSAFQRKARFKYIPMVVSVFLYGGMSNIDGLTRERQKKQIVNKHGFKVKYNLYYYYSYLYQILMLITKKMLPGTIFNSIRMLRLRLKGDRC